VRGNGDQIETALGNVISNAIFHTPQSGSIRIRLCQEKDAVRIEVENEGESIPDEQMALIWESFFRVDKAHNRQEGRYGLGLSIVKSIIDKYGGKYGASNTLKGVCFFLELPNFSSRV
jgi:signal transduction histidine kinase